MCGNSGKIERFPGNLENFEVIEKFLGNKISTSGNFGKTVKISKKLKKIR